MISWFGRMRRRDEEGADWRAQKMASARGFLLRMVAEYYDMAGLKGDDARIPTGQPPARQHAMLTTWMACNETRTDTLGRYWKQKKKEGIKIRRPSNPEQRAWVDYTASPSTKHIPERMNSERPRRTNLVSELKGRSDLHHPVGRLAEPWLRDAD
ncbi:hypothetical protein J3459_015759 [Metarhizium acridum]|nr:hypothetical protein J3459_015759 [Metarhizium acridum]